VARDRRALLRGAAAGRAFHAARQVGVSRPRVDPGWPVGPIIPARARVADVL
jgi:hypothetical protein